MASADDPLEEAFAQLQEVMREQNEADATADRLEKLKPGDHDYDEILNCYAEADDPRAATEKEIATLVSQWHEHHEHLGDYASELYDQLNEAGYDLRDFYAETLIKPKMRRLEQDPAKQQVRKLVDTLLNTLRPVEKTDGVVSTFTPTGASGASGASGYAGLTDAEELADVDVLDPDQAPMEGDLSHDKLTLYSETLDTTERDVAVSVDDNGTVWMHGFRIPKIFELVLQEHQMKAMLGALDNLQHGVHGTLIAFGMGLGKSLTTLVVLDIWMARNRAARAVLVCPKSVVNQWRREAEKWQLILNLDTYAITIADHAIEGTLKPWFKHGGVAIVGHDQFKRTVDCFKLTDQTILVIDEAHLLKQQDTQLYKEIQALPGMRRIFLTGSPLQNSLGEYYSMLQLLAPGVLGMTEGDFTRLLARPIKQGMLTGASDDEMRECDIHVHALRKQVELIVWEKSTSYLKEYIVKPKQEVCVLHGCNTVVSDSSVIKERHNVHTAARDTKVQTVVDIIDSIRRHANSDNIVVFSTRNDLLKDLHKQRPGHMYTGDMNIEHRDKVLLDYPAIDGDILYMATKAGGVGLNLTMANRVIIADVSWNPVDDNQAVARCYRMGQSKGVFVYRLVADLTLEKGVYLLGVNKQLTASRIMNERDVPRHFSKQDLAELSGPGSKADDVELETDEDAATAEIIVSHSVVDHSSRVVADADDVDNGTAQQQEQFHHLEQDSLNLLNLLCYNFIRVVHTEDRVEAVHPGAHAFEDGTLCPPYAPFFMAASGRQDSALAPSMASAHLETVFAINEAVCVQLGPLVTDTVVYSDLSQVKFRLEFRVVDDLYEEDGQYEIEKGRGPWGSYMCDFPARPSKQRLEILRAGVSTAEAAAAQQLPPGNYEFRAAIFDHEQMSPYSKESPVISLRAE